MGAANGQVLKWNDAANAWQPDEDDGGVGGDDWGDQTVATDNTSIIGSGVPSDPLRIKNGNNEGQILSWDSTSEEWILDQQETISYTAGNGISINNDNVITNTGDTNPNDDLLDSDLAGGDVSGTFSNLQINQGAIGSAEIANNSIQAVDLDDMNASNGQVLKWNAIANTWEPQNDSAGSGGDDWGDQTVETDNQWILGTGVTGDPVRLKDGSIDGGILKWNSNDGAWELGADEGESYSAGPGITFNGQAITNTGDTNPNDDLLDSDIAGGDVSGNFTNLQINSGVVGSTEIANNSIQSADIQDGTIELQDLALSGASANDVLKFDGNNWSFSPDESGDGGVEYTAGEGIGITDNVISALVNDPIWNAAALVGRPIGGMDPTEGQFFVYGDDGNGNNVWKSGTLDGDISGTFDDVEVQALKGRPIGGMDPTEGQFFVYGDDGNGNNVWKSGTLDGDISGTFDDVEVQALKGRPIGGMDPTEGQFFVFSGDSLKYGTLDGAVTGTFDQNELSIPLDVQNSLADPMVLMSNGDGPGLQGLASDNHGPIPIFGLAGLNNSDEDANALGVGVVGYSEPSANGSEGIGVWGRAVDNHLHGLGYGGIFQGRFVGLAAFAYGLSGNCSSTQGNAGIWTFGDFCTDAALKAYSNGAIHGGYFEGLESGGYSATTTGIYVEQNNADWAAFFNGNTNTLGEINSSFGFSGGLKAFKIDHPLDPTNKYLMHSCVESPDMKNIYDGNITTDTNGFATVELPDYFEALNKDFRYQLTVIGQFAQAIIAEKLSNNQFVIQTDKPNVEVSWQITGIRHDPFAEQNRIQVEVDKNEKEIGKYMHPEAYNQPKSSGVHYTEPMKMDREKISQIRRD